MGLVQSFPFITSLISSGIRSDLVPGYLSSLAIYTIYVANYFIIKIVSYSKTYRVSLQWQFLTRDDGEDANETEAGWQQDEGQFDFATINHMVD